ncbi:MAG: hypothetical protein U9N59_00070 [Campylobacterota bacterium]|nr:hypothetical protein [Campylobacterota bacterium]
MFEYFIIFLIVGMILGYLFDEQQAIIVIVIISILWLFIHGAWAVATFVELLIGYSVSKKLKQNV